jgi:two-component system OmpR family sensor kinase
MDGKGAIANSLQLKLSLWLALAIAVIAAAAGTFSFVSAQNDVHALQDNQLRQTGYLISRLDAVPASPLRARERPGDVDFDARVVVRFLPTTNHRDIPNPGRPPVFPSALPDGLQTVSVGIEQWRVFVRTNPQGLRVAVGQQVSVRNAAARASALRTLTPILLLVPVLALLVSVLVRQMFKPLTSLADELARRPEEELGALNERGLPSEVWPFVEQINMLLARMARALAYQRRFIANASHELRAPLSALSLQAARLGQAEMPGEARMRLNVLVGGLQRASLLVDQLLTLARAQEPGLEAPAALLLRQVIDEVLADLAPLAQEKNIAIQVDGDAGSRVAAKPIELQVLLRNLFDNAIRYTPDEGQVAITLGREDGLVTLQIDDTGPGIPMHERERVFDAFYRLLGSGEIGAGLGLAITRTVADQMEATIELGEAGMPALGLRVTVTFREAFSCP